jgi:hypothetical protein
MSLLGASAVDYLIERSLNPRGTRISANGVPAAELRGPGDAKVDVFTVTARGEDAGRPGDRWTLSPRIHGVVKPFSMTVKKIDYTTGDSSDDHADGAEKEDEGSPLFTIEHGLFFYTGRFYIFNGRPEGRPLRELLLGGKKYICRLDHFSFASIAEVNREAWSNLGRLRGVPVGELEGIGALGHHVRLLPELQPIGLPLAAASFLLYSTA